MKSSKKLEEERKALVSRLRTLCLRERILAGTFTKTYFGNSLRCTVTDRVDGKTRTLFVPSHRQEEVEKWNNNWKELKEIMTLISECQRAQFRLEEGHDATVKKAGAAVASRRKRLTKIKRTVS